MRCLLLQLMVGFNRGLMVLWNLESSSAELTYVAASVSFIIVIILIFVCLPACHISVNAH